MAQLHQALAQTPLRNSANSTMKIPAIEQGFSDYRATNVLFLRLYVVDFLLTGMDNFIHGSLIIATPINTSVRAGVT